MPHALTGLFANLHGDHLIVTPHGAVKKDKA
jgi:hypothetical protein